MDEQAIALMTPLESKDDLQNWILDNLGIELPDKVVSRFADTSPLDFVWEAYRAIMDGKSLNMVGVAGRDGCKTTALAVIDLLAFLHDKRDTVHIAMALDQGKRAKAYLEGFVNKNPIVSAAISKQNTKELKIIIDGEEVGMELIPATPKAVQGAHCSLLTFDELASSMQPENVRAVKDAGGIVGTSRKGKAAVVIKISSRQAGHSLIEREIKAGKAKIRKWTTFENTERCPSERSGTVPTPLWVNKFVGEAYTEEEFKLVEDGKKGDFELTKDTFDKCRSCPLASICQGDLKKQTSTSVLLRRIDDVITKIDAAGSWDWALAQLMSLKPSTEGLIYWEYDSKVHVPGWDAMWERLTGRPPNNPVNRQSFIAELKKRGAQFYGGIDWGFNPSPNVAVVMAVDRRGYMYIVEAVAKIRYNDPKFIEEVVRNELQAKYDVQMWCPDLANGSGRDLLIQAGLPSTDDIDKTIMKGINLVKGCLRSPGTNENRLMLAPDLMDGLPMVTRGGEARPLESIYDELELYHKKQDAAGNVKSDDDPAKEYDHFLDALRYMIYWLIGRQRCQVGTDHGDTGDVGEVTKTTNVPTLEEISKMKGIPYIDNREVKPGAQDEERGVSDAGGPLWSWT